MRILGLMRVRNEGRWLERCLAAQDFCERIILLDDNSTDNTPDICRRFDNVDYRRKTVDRGYDEGADREWLAREARAYSPDWICSMDGDEVLLPGSYQLLAPLFAQAACRVIEIHALHLWGDEQSVRVDGNFSQQYRQRFWRFPAGELTYQPWHCALPDQIGAPFARAGVQFLHYGYLTAADRLRHFQRELRLGRDGAILVQGDPGGPLASANLSGEPLRVEPLEKARTY